MTPKFNLLSAIQAYLADKPMFYAFIRPTEAELFSFNQQFVKGKILDFGCGDGFFSKLVFNDQKIDVGLDLMTNYAHLKSTQNCFLNDSYQQVLLYDGKKIAYPKNFFDCVISNCVLEHVDDIELSLTEINRILKLKGYFICTVMTNKWEEMLFGSKFFGNKYQQYWRKKQHHVHLYSFHKWIKLITQHHFKLIKASSYLSAGIVPLFELSHFLSFFSLISYQLFNKWVLFPNYYRLVALDKLILYLINHLSKNQAPQQNAAAFFIYQKTAR